MKQKYIKELIQRIGEGHLSKRIKRQVDLYEKFYARSQYSHYHLENIKAIAKVIKVGLKTVGLYNRGRKNTCRFRIINTNPKFENLPKEFHGFKILHLSDLHSDGYEDKGKTLISILNNVSVDLCVITGDFRFLNEHVHKSAIGLTEKIVSVVKAKYGIYGVLGNHDFIEFVPLIEKFGIKILLNESAEIKKDGQSIWLAGIDDAHYYDCHDIDRSLAGIPVNNFNIFLSHSPETYADVSQKNVDYFLCGHTHGGQICLPGGIMLFKNARCPRKYCSGPWTYNGMQGYTSRGTGSSGLPVRYNCPSEISIHQLAKS